VPTARPRSLLAVSLVAIAAAAALAQVGGGFGFGGRVRLQVQPNARYDGRFTFVRVNYESAPGGYWYRGLPAWAHGYPMAEQNLMKIMNELSYLGANVDAFAEGGGMGVAHANVANYGANHAGVAAVYSIMSDKLRGVRGSAMRGDLSVAMSFTADEQANLQATVDPKDKTPDATHVSTTSTT